MFRAATVCLARTAAQPNRKIAAVSPYAVFLVETANHQALTGLEIPARAVAAGKLWNSLPKSQKTAYAMMALKADPFPIHKGTGHNPPPFARYVQKYWSASPKNLSFEDRVVFLAEKFKASVARRAGAKKSAAAAATAKK